jgi:outer membrane lipoprotein carrier protein
MTRACLALFAVLLPGIAGADGAADERAAERLETALRGLSGLRAEFRQTVTDAQGQMVESASGTVSLARPGRFRWDYREPAQLIVSDGTTVWFHDVDLAQVTIQSAAETLVGTPAMLLAGAGDLRAEFKVAAGGEADHLAWTQLTPKTAEGDFRELRVGLSGDSLREMILVDRLGQTTRIEFDHVERNPRFDAATFRFTPPPGVDVVGRAPATAP